MAGGSQPIKRLVLLDFMGPPDLTIFRYHGIRELNVRSIDFEATMDSAAQFSSRFAYYHAPFWRVTKVPLPL